MMFRYADINDLNRVYEIEKECFPESEAASFDSLKHRIENGFFLLLEEEHEILSLSLIHILTLPTICSV